MRDRRVLLLTNMWPTGDAPTRGGFVRDQVRAVEALPDAPSFDVLVIDGRRGRRDYVRGLIELRRRVATGGYDLVHAHYGLTAFVAVLQRRVPVVATFHGSDLYIPWQRRVSTLAYRAAAVSIFVSDRLRRVLGEQTTGHVVPCGVDTDLFRPLDRESVRGRLGYGREELVVVFPGDPGRRVKNHGLFQAALDALPPPLRRRIRAVALTGLRHDEVPGFLTAADAVLVTSRYEGAGNVAKEAIACGTPVVSVDVGDIPEVIHALPGCATADATPGDLARALTTALAPRPPWDGRERLRALGVDAASVARRVLAVYDAVLEPRARAA